MKRSPIYQQLCDLNGIDYEAVLSYQRATSIYKGVQRGVPTEYEHQQYKLYQSARYKYQKEQKGTLMRPKKKTTRSLESSYQYKLKHGVPETITDEERAAHTQYFKEMKERNPNVRQQMKQAQLDYDKRMREDPDYLEKCRERRRDYELRKRVRIYEEQAKKEQNSGDTVSDENS
jgi:hypothetical protein